MLHIYGQEYWHCDVRIVGTREDMERLRDQITLALKPGHAPNAELYFPNDGEGYSVKIAVATEAEIRKLPHTYHDECCGPYTVEESNALTKLG